MISDAIRRRKNGGRARTAANCRSSVQALQCPADRQFRKRRRSFKSRGGDLAFNVVFRDGAVAPGSFCLIEAAVTALDHRLGGFGQPELRNADFIRSKASRTAPSANPTIRKAGTPALMSTSTSTANASTPERALESMLPSKFRPSEPPGAPREAKNY